MIKRCYICTELKTHCEKKRVMIRGNKKVVIKREKLGILKMEKINVMKKIGR